jgi:alkylhydroperoxidase/carboxymuconolactone decarboxylase family protein
MSDNYYKQEDLAKFAEVGHFAGEHMKSFFAYYTGATATDGALSKKEKSLIGLAVAHALKCPYCIDAYTTSCLENGSNPEQMTEAIHVAAALQAGITLIHGVQMQNSLKEKGVL